MGDVDIPANFKTSLPPRKRAKTKEEKEQRRIERILRNRKAAHASREKKRKHVEFLESYVLDLEKQMHLVKQLNDKLLTTYQGGNADIDSLISRVSSLPDLNAKKLQHATELDSVGCDDEEQENESEQYNTLPKTPESYTSSPKATLDVPGLEESRGSSISSQSSDVDSFSPHFLSQVSSPVTMDKFSLDIISAEPRSVDTSMTTSDDVFIKKETLDDFIPQIPQMETNSFGKLSFEDCHVKLEDNDLVLDELRNPAEIAADEFTIGWSSHVLEMGASICR